MCVCGGCRGRGEGDGAGPAPAPAPAPAPPAAAAAAAAAAPALSPAPGPAPVAATTPAPTSGASPRFHAVPTTPHAVSSSSARLTNDASSVTPAVLAAKTIFDTAAMGRAARRTAISSNTLHLHNVHTASVCLHNQAHQYTPGRQVPLRHVCQSGTAPRKALCLVLEAVAPQDDRDRHTHTFERFVVALTAAAMCRDAVLLTGQPPFLSSTLAPACGCGGCSVHRGFPATVCPECTCRFKCGLHRRQSWRRRLAVRLS